MSVKSLLEHSFFSKVLYTIAASAVIGGGTVVLNNQTRIAVLENISATEELRLERIESKIDALLERGH